ncbi:MAG: N-6 DNA methylase [Patescibacteria group bacterium]
MTQINYNERSWAIDLISEINIWLSQRNIVIKHAGGENTLNSEGNSLFPDVLLFGDLDKGKILQGWELKLPDTPIEDEEYIRNAKKKAELLSLNSFLLWNVAKAVLYKIEEDGTHSIIKTWNNLSHLTNRAEVLQNKREISNMLEEILNDINSFIVSNTIKSTSVVTALSSETVTGLVQNNLSSYVEALQENAQTNSNFADEITLWWRYAKNDYPEESNKFRVLGRNNLLFLVNKFLFAHILKSYQEQANSVDKIGDDTDVQTALKIFTTISQECDFWNIFVPQMGEELVTQDVWNDILKFNNLLKEFDFSNIEKTLLHDLLGRIVYRNKRKFAGQFTTPQELARFAVTITIDDPNANTIDPCCGTGTIVKEMYSRKKKTLSTEESLNTLWGSDKFSLPLQMAMFNLVDPEAIGKVINIFKKDAMELQTDEVIELHDPYDGSIVHKNLPKFGYIISNLPFVQQRDIETLNPNAFSANVQIRNTIGEEYELDGRSDLYAYLPFHLWNLLAENGKLSIIVSNSWLGTAWGEKFYKALTHFFVLENIATSGNGRWFDNAKVVTNIITLRKKAIPEAPSDDEKTKFTVTKKAISDYDEESSEEIKALIKNEDFVNEQDIYINTYTNKDIETLLELGLNLNSFFAENSWLLELKEKMVRVSSFFDIGRGERRGWDKLFYPEDKNNIEERYLKPVLKTPRSIKNYVANPDALAFCCTLSKEELQKAGHLGALEWINKFEGQTNGTGVPLPDCLARAGMNWYTMLPNTMAEIVTNINFGDRLFFARFDEPTFVNQRLVRFTKKDNTVDVVLCNALLNSIVGLLYIEAMGTGRGEGALDLSTDKIKNDLRFINPNLLEETDKQTIVHLFNKIESRAILPIEQELEQEDRIAFDNAILKAIGKPTYRDKIKKSLLTLYKIRVSVND